MLALYRTGRQADALDAYQRLRRTPAPTISASTRARVARRWSRDPAPGPGSGPATGRPPQPGPRGGAGARPSSPATCRLHRPRPRARRPGRARRTRAPGPAAVMISAISGTAGVGKTALAVHWAHRVAGRFPDGQLYVNLRGFDPAAPVVTRPRRCGGSSTRWACRRPDPGRPGRPGRPVPQPAGRPAGAGRAGQRARRRAGPPAAARLARLPGRGDQPHQLTGAGRHRGRPAAHARPPLRRGGPAICWPAASARRPGHGRTGRGRRDRRAGAPGFRWRWRSSRPAPPPTASCRWRRWPASCATRAAVWPPSTAATGPPTCARCSPGPTAPSTRTPPGCSGCSACTRVPTIDARGGQPGRAAGRAGCGRCWPSSTGRSCSPSTRRGRYSLPRPAPRYAAELAARGRHREDRRAAVHRMLDHYLHTAYAAVAVLHPRRDPITLPRRSPRGRVAEIRHDREARAGLVRRRVPGADGRGRPGRRRRPRRDAWQLAWTLWDFLDRRGHWHDLDRDDGCGAAAATAGRPSAQAAIHRRARWPAGRPDTAPTRTPPSGTPSTCTADSATGPARRTPT